MSYVDTKKIKLKGKPCERSLLAEKEEKILTHISNFRPLKRIIDVISIFEGVQLKIKSKLAFPSSTCSRYWLPLC